MLEDQSFAAPQNPLATLGGADLASYGASNPFVSQISSSPAAPRSSVSSPSYLNNNPGNLIDNAWTQSLPGYTGASGRFAKFDSPQTGFDAIDRNLLSYASRGVSTPLALASTWAPKGDGANNPEAYAKAIADELGVKSSDSIDLHDPTTRSKVSQVIARVEGMGGKGSGSGAENAPAASTPTADAPQDSDSPPASAASGQPNPKGLFTLALLQALAPMHKFSAVDYDPFKVMPK